MCCWNSPYWCCGCYRNLFQVQKSRSKINIPSVITCYKKNYSSDNSVTTMDQWMDYIGYICVSLSSQVKNKAEMPSFSVKIKNTVNLNSILAEGKMWQMILMSPPIEITQKIIGSFGRSRFDLPFACYHDYEAWDSDGNVHHFPHFPHNLRNFPFRGYSLGRPSDI